MSRPEALPFDIRQKRILNYRSVEETTARAAERRTLQSVLKDAVGTILTQHHIASRGEYPVQLSMTYRVESQSSDLHEYLLNVDLTNSGVKIISQWHVDIEMPTPLLKKASSHVGFISQRSNKEVSLIRFTAENHNGPIFPGDTRRLSISYRMNQELYERRGNLLEQAVKVRAYIQDTAVALLLSVVQRAKANLGKNASTSAVDRIQRTAWIIRIHRVVDIARITGVIWIIRIQQAIGVVRVHRIVGISKTGGVIWIIRIQRTIGIGRVHRMIRIATAARVLRVVRIIAITPLAAVHCSYGLTPAPGP